MGYKLIEVEDPENLQMLRVRRFRLDVSRSVRQESRR